MGLDVSVADALGVDVGEAPEELVHVQLDEGRRDRLLALAVLPRHLVHRLGDELQHQVLIECIWECGLGGYFG